MLTLLLTNMLTLAFSIQPLKAEPSTLTVPDDSAAIQATINAGSQEPPPTEWNKTYGGTTDDYAWALVQASDGGYALAGYTTSFGAGSGDFWLVKTDAAGTMQWNKTYGGTGDDGAYSVIQTSDSGYAVVGYTTSFGAGSGDFWLVKTDAAGTMQWNKTYGGTSADTACSVVQTGDGGYALAGITHSFGAGSVDFWLVKTDANGDMQWNKTYGGTGDDEANALVQTNDGGYALAGYTGPGGYDCWLVKTDASGNALWNKTYGGTIDDYAFALVQASDGGYALAGLTTSFHTGYDDDFWLVKTDVSGNMLWSRTYGGTGDDLAHALVQTSDGGYALAGWTISFGADNDDSWLVKTDVNGNMQWNKTYGGTGDDEAFALVQTVDGGYAAAGFTNSYPARDFWLVKLSARAKSASSFIFHLFSR